jgi:hypothetical protein
MKGKHVVVPALVLVAAAAGGYWFTRDRGGPPAAARPMAVQTAAIVRQDMSTTEALPGTLGYGTARPVKGGGDGIVTWLPKPGASIKRGGQLYRVNDQPVPLFYGSLPLFRPLATPNITGRDVKLVADNLRALGYSVGRQPRAVRPGEAVLTEALIAAIKRWQTDARVPATGHLAPGDVVVQAGAVRVDSIAAQLGDGAAAPLMSVTPTAKVITVSADPSQAGSIERGDRVTVELPDGKTAAGKVATVGTTLQTADAQAGDPNPPPKLAVTVTVDNPKLLTRLDAADVQVNFAGETHKGVLAAPIGALLALSEGGYAVQLPGGTLIAVKVGMFAEGLVEVSGDGLSAGTRVVTTS